MSIQFKDENSFRSITNENTQEIILGKDLSFSWHLKERLEELNMSVRQLARITGLRPSVISTYNQGKLQGTALNLEHVFAIMIALRLTDSSQLFTIDMPRSRKLTFTRERKEWLSSGIMPAELRKLEAKNKSK